MKPFLILIALSFLLILLALLIRYLRRPGAKDVYEKPSKAQITLRIQVGEEITKADLEGQLMALYSSTMRRSGFRWRKHANAVSIFAYPTKRKEVDNLWIAWLYKTTTDDQPKIRFDDEQFKYLGTKSEEKFGLSEERRKQIYKDIISIELKAEKEAKEECPLKHNREYPIDDDDLQRSLKQHVLRSRLREEYRADLTGKLGLTYDQLIQISVEGTYKGWQIEQ